MNFRIREEIVILQCRKQRQSSSPMHSVMELIIIKVQNPLMGVLQQLNNFENSSKMGNNDENPSSNCVLLDFSGWILGTRRDMYIKSQKRYTKLPDV